VDSYPIIALAVIAVVVVTHQRADGLVFAAAKARSVSSFGRPLRKGPGFPTAPAPAEAPNEEAKPEPKPQGPTSEGPVSAFGRPLRPGPGR